MGKRYQRQRDRHRLAAQRLANMTDAQRKRLPPDVLTKMELGARRWHEYQRTHRETPREL